MSDSKIQISQKLFYPYVALKVYQAKVIMSVTKTDLTIILSVIVDKEPKSWKSDLAFSALYRWISK